MGNKLYVDYKNTPIEEILNFNLDNLQNTNNITILSEIELNNNSEKNFKNLKVWRFYESEDEKINSESIKLTKIKEDRFLLSSAETYLILIIFKLKDDFEDMSIFPNSLWGVVESSSNMTPRGLKYAFSASNSENLESYLLSKRDFKNSDYKYLLFIWNGKNCAPLLKSHVLMKAFDLDKKLYNPNILPYLYYGCSIENNQLVKNYIVNLNQIIKNTFENLSEEPGTPSTESFINYHETVYLLQLLYTKKINKRSKLLNLNNQNNLKKNNLFGKFNRNFLNSKNKISFYDNFLNLDNFLVLNSKRSQFSRENNTNFDNIDTFSLMKPNKINKEIEEKESKSFTENIGVEEEEEEEELNPSEYSEDDLNDDLYFEDNMVTNIGIMSKLNNNNNKFINLNRVSLTNSQTNSVNNPINNFKIFNSKINNEVKSININNININNIALRERNEDLTSSSNRNINSSRYNYEILKSPNIEDSFGNNEESFAMSSNTSLPVENKNSNINSNYVSQTRNTKITNQEFNLENFNNENFSFNEFGKNNIRIISNQNEAMNKSRESSQNKNTKVSNFININNNINQNKANNKNSLKIDLLNANNQKNSNMKQISKVSEIKIPKLIMGIQHKILNDDMISQRMNQQSEEEEKLDNLPDSVIKKSSDKIFSLKKLDFKNLIETKNNKNNFTESISNLKTNLEKLDISKINENYNIRDSDRKQIVMDFFSKNISEVLDGFLYLSNYNVAKTKEIIFANKITHIVNCAADNCQNHFLDDEISYTNYYLKDHPLEVKICKINCI